MPFFKDLLLNLGWMFIPFAAFVMVGASNAVNLTDGLDGLAIVPVMIAAGCFALISYLVGNIVFSNYLQLHYVAGSGELTVFCAAMLGATDSLVSQLNDASDALPAELAGDPRDVQPSNRMDVALDDRDAQVRQVGVTDSHLTGNSQAGQQIFVDQGSHHSRLT